jgi:HB1, ASXL, restriction endonuclease HTH domain
MATATKKKTASKKQQAKTGRAAVRRAKAEGKLSAIDAAAKVLGETGQAMTAKELIEAMAAKGYWTSPHGLTPQATLFAALSREVSTKGKDARFVKTEPGKFALKA